MYDNNKIADFGEKLAADYLVKKGYLILAKNIQVGHQEIDIIAKIKEKIVFVEVKTRTNQAYGYANDALGRWKYKTLKWAIYKYVSFRKIDPENARLDFIAIDINKLSRKANIKHYINIL